MISVDKINDGLPISVIIPLSEKRKGFFYSYVLPLIEANQPNEIIINSNHGFAPKKRNEGFKKSTQPYIFFCDDDIVLPCNILEKFLNKLEENSKVGYVYCSYDGIVLNSENHPIKKNFKIESKPFNPDLLKKMNYISTMSLMRREVFPGFDEKLKRFQDWSLFLTLLENNVIGEFVNNVSFFAFYLDEGITNTKNNIDVVYREIIKKHNL